MLEGVEEDVVVKPQEEEVPGIESLVEAEEGDRSRSEPSEQEYNRPL